MSDLVQTVEEALKQLGDLSARVAQARRSADESSDGLASALAHLEERASLIPPRSKTCQEALEVGGRTLETAASVALSELNAVSAWALDRERELALVGQQTALEFAAMHTELEGLRADLAQQRQAAAQVFDSCTQKTQHSFSELSSDLSGLEQWVGGQLTPLLRKEQHDLGAATEALKVHIRDRSIPAVTADYELMQSHLLQLTSTLSASLSGSLEETWTRTLEALTELARVMDLLCSRNAEEAQKVSAVIDAEQKPILARVADLNKQVKIYLELGTPAATHLGMLIGVVFYLEDLLIQAKVLNQGAA